MSDLDQLNFSDEAYILYRKFVADFELRFRPGGDLTGVIAGWASKLPGTLARIAANLALFDDHRIHVEKKYLECALALAEYYIENAKQLFGVMSGNTSIGRESDIKQEQIIKWIRTKAERTESGEVVPFTASKIANIIRYWKGPFKITTAKCTELVEKTLEEIINDCENLWIVALGSNGPTRSGRPTTKYVVNLELMEEELSKTSR